MRPVSVPPEQCYSQAVGPTRKFGCSLAVFSIKSHPRKLELSFPSILLNPSSRPQRNPVSLVLGVNPVPLSSAI